MSSTGAPQGTLPSHLLFPLNSSNLLFNLRMRPLQKFSDYSSCEQRQMATRRSNPELKVESFVCWCDINHLQLNMGEELAVYYRRNKCPNYHHLPREGGGAAGHLQAPGNTHEQSPLKQWFSNFFYQRTPLRYFLNSVSPSQTQNIFWGNKIIK